MAFLMQELIKTKRDGKPLSKKEIDYIINGFTEGSIPDYQISALLMAIFLKGMTTDETHLLADCMLKSGDVVNMSHIVGMKVDKHSTGGVGDKTSLILGPIVAAAGVYVPMISGRGLGHTGGTLDKLESIPGFSTQLSLEQFRSITAEHGICFIGQTKEICPADKKMYALRDVTGTVESLPLICASIMSKKLAEGIDALVLDVKFGSGAFMKSINKAEELARALAAIGKKAGKHVVAMLTRMDEPLGRMIGNSLEIEECLSILRNDEKAHLYSDCRDLSVELAGAMIWLGNKASDLDEGKHIAAEILASGKALKKFEEVVRIQGGDLSRLPRAKFRRDIVSLQDANIVSMNTESIGLASLVLGAGRRVSSDVIDPSAGIEIHQKIGARVRRGDKLFTLYANDEAKFEGVGDSLLRSIMFNKDQPKSEPLIAKIITDYI